MTWRPLRVILFAVLGILLAAVVGSVVLQSPESDPQSLPNTGTAPGGEQAAQTPIPDLKSRFCRARVADSDLAHEAAALDEILRRAKWLRDQQRILRVYPLERSDGASGAQQWTIVIGSDFDAGLVSIVLTPCTGEVRRDRRL